MSTIYEDVLSDRVMDKETAIDKACFVAKGR